MNTVLMTGASADARKRSRLTTAAAWLGRILIASDAGFAAAGLYMKGA